MKKLVVVLGIISSICLSAQSNDHNPAFSTSRIGIVGGANFYSTSEMGGSVIFEYKTNIAKDLNLKLSAGYAVLIDDDSYETKTYSHGGFNIDNYYHTNLFAVDKIEYTLVPINLGLEYTFLQSKLRPFSVVEVGYNISSAKAIGTDHDNFAGFYETFEEIPVEYRNHPEVLDQGSSFTAGIGVGLKYVLSDRMDLNIRYVYRYNAAIVNSNQILLGITF